MIKINNTNKLVKASFLLAIAIVFQFLGRTFPEISQMFVGPAINAILLLTVLICGLWYGLAIGCLTPILAFILGQLPTPFGPFIPFIIVGNLLYVYIFNLFIKGKINKQSIGIIIGSLLKFAFLFISSNYIISALKIIGNQAVVSKLAIAMGILQLITSLLGGIAALIIIQILKKRERDVI